MGKVLRILVILLLVLSGVSAVLSFRLFNTRKELSASRDRLADLVVAVSKTIEAAPAASPATTPVVHDAKDESPCTADPIDQPKLSTFWDNYKDALEGSDQAPVVMSIDKSLLNKIERIDTGAAKDVTDKAIAQYSLLTDTRQQLRTLREEYAKTVTDLNSVKKALRGELVKAVANEKKLTEQDTVLAPLKTQVAELETKTAELDASVKDKETQLNDEIRKSGEKDKDVERLKAKLLKLERDMREAAAETPAAASTGDGDESATATKAPAALSLTHGIKGVVTFVNNEWGFALIQLNDEALKEFFGEDLSSSFAPGAELLVSRAVSGDNYVSKVRLISGRSGEKTVVADIMSAWDNPEMRPIQAGDLVIF